MFRFTIRDVLWLTVVVALAAGWYCDRANQEAAQSFMTAFTDMRVLLDDVVVNDDAVEYQWTLVGTNNVPFTFRNPVIVYDLGRQQIIAQGAFKAAPISTNAAATNTSLLPRIVPAPAPKSAPRK